jgi:hypothetical protein
MQKIVDVSRAKVVRPSGRIWENAKADGVPYKYGAPVEFNQRNLDFLYGKKDKRGIRRG